MVGRAALVCGPPFWSGVLRSGAVCFVVWRCVVCGGVWPPVWWGVLLWCLAPLSMGRVVVVCGPPHGGACFVGVFGFRFVVF